MMEDLNHSALTERCGEPHILSAMRQSHQNQNRPVCLVMILLRGHILQKDSAGEGNFY